jgi:hypothetical protein
MEKSLSRRERPSRLKAAVDAEAATGDQAVADVFRSIFSG